MGWLHIDDNRGRRDGLREGMRRKMSARHQSGMREEYDGDKESEEIWCDGYEKGWADAMREVSEGNRR